MFSQGMMLADRFQVHSLLKVSGMGQVWVGEDVLAKVKVAIKVLRPELANKEALVNQFNREIAALQRISHPAIVQYLAAGETEQNLPYLVTEFVVGQPLRNFVTQGGIDLAQVAIIIEQLGEAIQAIHDYGICHRDLKPENILITAPSTKDPNKWVIKIIDFGIALIEESKDGGGENTGILGTVDYMAPEQIYDNKPTSSSDIYAMGVIAYELVAGIMPFNVRNVEAAAMTLQLYELQQKFPHSVPALTQLRPQLPATAERLIMQALAFRPQDRPPRADLLGKELAAALCQPPQPKSAAANPRQLIALVASVSLVVLVGGSWMIYQAIQNLAQRSLQTTQTLPASSAHLPTPLASGSASETPDFQARYYFKVALPKDQYRRHILLTGKEMLLERQAQIYFCLETELPCYVYVISETKTAHGPHYTLLTTVAHTDRNFLTQTLTVPSLTERGFTPKFEQNTEQVLLLFSSQQITVLNNLAQSLTASVALDLPTDVIVQLQPLLQQATLAQTVLTSKMARTTVSANKITMARVSLRVRDS
jgi:serine/threonine protein kinase